MATLLQQLRNPLSDLRLEVQNDLVPMMAFAIDCAQYSTAAFSVSADFFPSWAVPVVKFLGALFLVDVPLPTVAFHVVFHLLAGAILVSAFPFVVSTQHILEVMGELGTQVLFAVAILVQTVFLIPSARFLLRTMTCQDGHPLPLPDEACYAGTHGYYIVAAPGLLCLLLAIVVKWESLSTGALELAKQDRVFRMSTHHSWFGLQTLALKVIFVIPLSVLAPLLSKSAVVLALLLVSTALLSVLLYDRPFYYISTTAALSVLLFVACTSNLVSLLVMASSSLAGTVIVVSYLVALGPTCYCWFAMVEGWLAGDVVQSIVSQVLTSERDARAAKAAPGKAGKTSAVEGQPGSSLSPCHLNLERKLPGLRHASVIRIVDFFFRIPMESVALGYNTFSMLNLSVISAALMSSSADTLQEIDLSNNRGMFVRGLRATTTYQAMLRRVEHSIPNTPAQYGSRSNYAAVAHLNADSDSDDADRDLESQNSERKVDACPARIRNQGTREDLKLAGCPMNRASSSDTAPNTPGTVDAESACPFQAPPAKPQHASYEQPTIGDVFLDRMAHGLRDGAEWVSATVHNVCQHPGTDTLAVRLPFTDVCGGMDRLFEACHCLRRVNLQRTELPLEVFSALVAGLERTPVEELDVSVCGLGYAHCAELALLLRRDTLTSLKMRYNQAGTRGAKCLAAAIPQATKIQVLDIGWNSIGVEGARAIVNSITSYVDLNVDCNSMAHPDFLRVKREIKAALNQFDDIRRQTTAAMPDESILGGKTICELVGGEDAVAALVDRMYMYLVTDPKLSRFFQNISMGRMRHLQASFIASALGSARPYKGRDLQQAHAHMLITDDIYDQVMTWIAVAMHDCAPEVPQHLLMMIMAKVEGLRSVVVTQSIAKVATDITSQHSFALHVDPESN